jgi:hypothetical protein
MEKNRAIYPCICKLYVYYTISKNSKFQKFHKISKLITKNIYYYIIKGLLHEYSCNNRILLLEMHQKQ